MMDLILDSTQSSFAWPLTPYTSTVLLLEPYCGAITDPGLPVLRVSQQRMGKFRIPRRTGASAS